jgi:hypothetical protein
MATLVVQNAVQVTVQMSHGGRVVDNVLAFQVPVGFLGTDLAGLANAVKTNWESVTGPMSQHGVGTTVTGYKAVDIRSTTGMIYLLSSTKAGAVTGAGAVMSAAALVTVGGGTRNRTGNGRVYHGPLQVSQVNVDGRTLVAATQTGISAAYNDFLAKMATAGYPWRVCSRKTSLLYPITNVATQSVLATQRRRMRS